MSSVASAIRQKCSLISTVLNDLEGTRLFLARMAEQTRKPDEIVILDAGSTDGTWELLQHFAAIGTIPFKLLQSAGCKPATSRNLCAKEANYQILAVTDIGCDWEPRWFEDLVAPFAQDPSLEAVMGSWRVRWQDQQTVWAQADPLLRGGIEFIATPQSQAANRSIAYKKDFYFRLGGLPEDLSFACDDTTLALLIQRHGRKVAAATNPACIWHRPQSFKTLVREARRNFKGAGEAGIWLRFFAVNSTRFVLEWLALGILATSRVMRYPPTVVYSFGFLALVLVLWRLCNWGPHWRKLHARGSLATPLHVGWLDYATRFNGVFGYFQGLRRGQLHCLETRGKLRDAGYGWW